MKMIHIKRLFTKAVTIFTQMALILEAGCVMPISGQAAVAKPTLKKKSATIEPGASVQIRVSGKKIRSKTFRSSDTRIATVSKKKGKVTGKKAGTAKITVTVSYKPAKKIKKVKLTFTAHVVEKTKPTPEPTMEPTPEPTSDPRTKPARSPRPDLKDAEAIIRYYNNPAEQNQPFRDSIYAFSEEVEELPLSEKAKQIKASAKELSKVTVRRLLIGEVSLYDVYVDDGKKKPLVISVHGGGGTKDQTLENSVWDALNGFHMAVIDAACYGDSPLGPMDAVTIFAETVYQIDTLIEYYNTQDDVDAYHFGICGGSMGGAIAFIYVAHGLYRPAVIGAHIGTPDLTLLTNELRSCYDHGAEVPGGVMSFEQSKEFARQYSPSNWPLRFKDTFIYSASGMKDPSNAHKGCQDLENALKDAGYDQFEFYYFENYGHEKLPVDTRELMKNKLLEIFRESQNGEGV